MSDDGGALLEKLRGLVGKPAGAPFRAWDEVNQPMIRHWCDAVGDTNPIYTDPSAAAASVHGQVVAPPTMLQAWTMRGLVPPPSEGGGAQAELMGLLDAAGFTSVVATNCEQEYERYLHLGDDLTAEQVIEDVSPEKKTGLGVGHFVTTRTEFRDQNGELVATMRFRILKFRPPEKTEPKAPRPVPPRNQDNAFFWEGVDRGELLIQRCSACGQLRHPPRPMCPNCQALEWDTVQSSGKGEVFSFIIPHYPQVPFLDYPYVVAVIALEEGTRLISNVIDIDPHAVDVGMPVEVKFVKVHDELTLPLFAPVSA
ncbi:MAG: bifunctional MaoC family dehydratase/OB-fold nucleic acid binding domain-containing protein [Acidimicrobiia bacterium]|nr:bifunctional MaoC family dehydratase/OB-fold nucleic acid binding domain-containing protein [Acidimicrobiia bacterium]